MKSDAKPEVCVVGLGYIGLPTAAIVARAGCRVRGVDVSERVVETINRGEIHIEEVDLDGLVVHDHEPGVALLAGGGVADLRANPDADRGTTLEALDGVAVGHGSADSWESRRGYRDRHDRTRMPRSATA